jgi:Zinc-finger domain of monoamine-oxidase A repressor R1
VHTAAGKSECGRCGSSQGRFCRACLLVRYGVALEDVRAAGSSWLCPHCYEAEHPEQVPTYSEKPEMSIISI